MANWPKAKLGDHVNLVSGFAFKSQQFSDKPDDIALVKGENVGQGHILWSISKRWPADDWAKMGKFQLQSGDVVVAMDRPWVPAGLKWGYIRHDDPRALLVQRCARLRSSNVRLEQSFLRFVVGGPGFEDYVRPITTGVNVPHISGQQILDYEFTLPPPAAQQRIAAILSAYDELIENSQRRIKILESTTRGMYREWFVHFRFPGREGDTRAASPHRHIPKGWQGTFGQITGLDREPVNPSDFPGEQFEHFSIPAFDDGYPVVEPAEAILSNKHVIDKSCVLLSKLNPRIPRVWLPAPNGAQRAIASTEFLVLKPKAGFTREFIFAVCSSEEFAGRYATLAGGTSTSHQRVKPESLLAMPTVVPNRSIVTAFTRLVTPMLVMSETLRNRIHILRRTRDLLLPRLLSGQIDVGAA